MYELTARTPPSSIVDNYYIAECSSVATHGA